MAQNSLLDFLQGASNAAASNISAPVDGIAWLLRKAGIPVPDAPIGGSDWMARKGLTVQPQNQLAGLLGESVGGVAPIVAAAKAPQIAKGLLQVEANAAAPRTLRPEAGAIVWHGSPHKFDRFDASKIGTGEGAQAYGHGLYLAEARDVGADYANVLASPRNRVSDRRGVYIEPSPMGGGKYMLAVNSEVGQPRGMAADATQFIYSDKEFPNLASAMKFARQKGLLARDERPRLTAINEDRKYVPVSKAADVPDPEYTQFIASNPGYLYKVDLPDEKIARMLDWDKPLHRQVPEVRRAVRGLVDETLGPGAYGGLIKNRPDIKDLQNNALEGLTQAQIAEALRQRGVPGIRYLDGGSRSAGAGTSNFVVFPGEEQFLRILERNGGLLSP